MSKYFLYLAILIFTCQTFAQKKEDEKIESLKTAFITDALSLSKKEAQEFWPIYNHYEKKKDSLYGDKWCQVKNGLNTIETIEEKKADELLSTYIKMKEERLQLRKDFINELKKLMSAKEILTLKKAEQDFHKMLLEKYKK